MSETSGRSEASLRPEEIQMLAAHAGLPLSPAHLAELVDAYGYIAAMLGRIRRDHPYGNEPAHVFVPLAFEPPGFVPPTSAPAGPEAP